MKIRGFVSAAAAGTAAAALTAALTAVSLLTAPATAVAQSTQAYYWPVHQFDEAVVLYQNGKYAAAKRAFTLAERKLEAAEQGYNALHGISVNGSRLSRDADRMREDCMYYKAMCDVMLYRRNGSSALLDFVTAYPGSNRINSAYLQLANFEYDCSHFRSAYEYYAKVDVDELNRNSKDYARFFFRAGYSAFQSRKPDDAKLYFSKVLDGNGDASYTVLATYYYAYILYSEGAYQSALAYFEKIQDEPSLQGVVPACIMQCHHVLGHDDEVLALGPALIEKVKEKRAAEIGRMVGEAFYNKQLYAEAIPYMRSFYENSAMLPDAGGCFILAYCYYKAENYDSAAFFFQQVLNLGPEPAMRQSSLYHLAYCYLQQDRRKFAMDAFADASRIRGANDVMAEDAAYHRARLACELGLTSYRTSIKVLEEFLETYPSSPYAKRINSYLAGMYASTKDYDKALASIERIGVKTPEIEAAHQRLLYNKGAESFLRRAYGTALEYFGRSATLDIDEKITLQAIFWQGECHAVSGNYISAKRFYKNFLDASLSRSLPEYPKALFSMAFANMELVNYPEALRYWKMFLETGAESALRADAYAREGDCHFMLEEYDAAIASYAKAQQNHYLPADYAPMQTALCLGALGRYPEKINGLLAMERDYPTSLYKTRIWQELGATYLMTDQNDKALQYYRKLRDYQPGSPAALNAATKMGLIYFNRGDNEQALNCFKSVAKANPSSEEGRQALVSIRNIYMSMNQIDKFFAYVKTVPSVSIGQSEQDSLTYQVAENFYLDGNYPQALSAFKKYLDDYPEGIFMVDAWKNAALCAERTGDRANLKAALSKMTQFKISEAEDAARKVADIYYADKEYKPALGYYEKLEELSLQSGSNENLIAARMGKMHSQKALGKSKEVVNTALEVLRTDGLGEIDRDEARYFIAVSAPAIGEKELSMRQYELLTESKNPDYASEARYVILEQRFRSGFYDEAEKLVYEMIAAPSINDFYLAKAFLLWADIYYHRGNVLQARQTLQSIVDGYEGEDLQQEARDRLKMIDEKEAELLKNEQELREARYPDEAEIALPQM